MHFKELSFLTSRVFYCPLAGNCLHSSINYKAFSSQSKKRRHTSDVPNRNVSMNLLTDHYIRLYILRQISQQFLIPHNYKIFALQEISNNQFHFVFFNLMISDIYDASTIKFLQKH